MLHGIEKQQTNKTNDNCHYYGHWAIRQTETDRYDLCDQNQQLTFSKRERNYWTASRNIDNILIRRVLLSTTYHIAVWHLWLSEWRLHSVTSFLMRVITFLGTNSSSCLSAQRQMFVGLFWKWNIVTWIDKTTVVRNWHTRMDKFAAWKWERYWIR